MEASREASWAGSFESPPGAEISISRRLEGAPAYLFMGKGPQGAGRRENFNRLERRTMLRRNFVGIVVLSLVWTVAAGAQIKEMPRTPVRPLNARIVDINTAPEADIAAVGIDRPVAKKIVEGRPYRNKRDLVTRQLLTREQYDKVKDLIVAKRS